MSRRNRERRERNRELKYQPTAESSRRPFRRYALVAAAVGALLAASFVVPRLIGENEPVAAAGGTQHHGDHSGDGLEVGVAAPGFSERDVVTGEPISTETIANRKTLLFFSEGVMCQACFVQIRDLEQVGDRLDERGIDLVSITPDPPDLLRQAVAQYAITTPMIADDDRDMSAAFDTLGQGMHPDTPGHAFVLVDEDGTIVWQRDYWLEPYRTMYIEPARLLDDMPTA